MTQRSTPTRSLSDRPNLDQLKRQAKELLDAFRDRDAAAAKEVHAHFRRAAPATFALHDAQLVLARAYGFDSWPKLKAFVDGVTVRRLVAAVRAGDLAAVESMVNVRPELVHLDTAGDDERRALHYAVLERHPDIVQFLMRHGADARKGIWPHRCATTAFTLASERGYSEIVAIIEQEERRRPADAKPASLLRQAAAGVADFFRRGDDEASAARAAIAAGDAAWLRARHEDGLLRDGNGLVGHAVAVNRPDMLALLLELGLDPDESARVDGLEEVVHTWGEPLRACAIAGNVSMAEILLRHGANATTNVYAATWALFEAYRRHDDRMIALLEQHGARLTAIGVALLGLVAQAAQRIGDDAGSAWDLLWGAIESPSPEIVEVVLPHVSWPRDDPRWHSILENGLHLDRTSDRIRHLDAFRLVLNCCDPDVRSSRNTTLLHDIAASRGGLTADDRTAYATLVLDRGARLDIRDDLLKSTPLGWACRWGRIEMVALLLDRGADPIEANAELWASPLAWAKRSGRGDVAALLEKAAAR